MDWQTRHQWENLLDFHRQWEWVGARKTSQNAQVRFKIVWKKYYSSSFWLEGTYYAQFQCLQIIAFFTFSFGYCEKVAVGNHQPIGHYGNGFKSGSMRLGKDAIVFSRRMDVMSVGLLSQTYLKSIKAETVLVPIISWDLPNSILWFVNRLRQYTKDNVPKTFAVTSSNIFDERIVTIRINFIFSLIGFEQMFSDFIIGPTKLKCYNGQGYCRVVGINSLYTATCFKSCFRNRVMRSL